MLTLQLVFHQPLRQTEGFVGTIFALMGLDLLVPDHRCGGLTRSRRVASIKASLDPVADSTGLKIYGPGEWQGERKKRSRPCCAWRKLHGGINPVDGEIVASGLSDHDVGDVTVLPRLLDQVDGRINCFLGGGTYDGDPSYRLLKQRRQSSPLPEVIVPPRGASLGLAKAEELLRQRDRHVQTIQDNGRMAWQKSSGYNPRALVEATISRYKRIVGRGLESCDPHAQRIEAMMGVDVLKHMFRLGRSTIEWIG